MRGRRRRSWSAACDKSIRAQQVVRLRLRGFCDEELGRRSASGVEADWGAPLGAPSVTPLEKIARGTS